MTLQIIHELLRQFDRHVIYDVAILVVTHELIHFTPAENGCYLFRLVVWRCCPFERCS